MSNKNRQVGFSLIEILISISVLLVVLGGVTSMAVGIVKTSATNKYQIEAYGQAQKQLELAKQFRNSNNLDAKSRTSWDTDKNGNNLVLGSNYNFDIDANGKISLKIGVKNWRSNSTNKNYRIRTVFDKVSSDISGQDDLLIKTIVGWSEAGNQREIELRTALTNWYWTYE